MTVPVIPDPIEVYAGDAWSQPFQIKNPDGTPQNLTGFTGWACQWRRSATADTAITLAITLTELANGRFTVTATPEQTRQMGGSGVFDVQAGPRTFLRGRTDWIEDVTRG